MPERDDSSQYSDLGRDLDRSPLPTAPNLLSRVVRARESLIDGDAGLAAAILADLEVDLAAAAAEIS
jgi:hypothetical protein